MSSAAPVSGERVADELGQMLETLGGSDALMLFQYNVASGSYQYLRRLETSTGDDAPIMLERIRELYPDGGRFILRRHGVNPDTGQKGYIAGTPPFELAPAPGREGRRETRDEDPVSDLRAELRELRDLMARPAQPQGLGMEAVVTLASQLSASQAPLLQALAERDRIDAVQLLEVWQNAFDRGREENGGGSRPYDRIDGLLTQALGVLTGAAVSNGREVPAGRPAVTGAPPGAVPQLPPPPPPPVETNTETNIGALPAHVQRIIPHLPRLVDAARQRIAPELVAASVASQLPPAELHAMAGDPVLLDDLCAAHPPLARYRSWAGELLECIAEQLEDEDGVQDEDDDAGGDAAA